MSGEVGKIFGDSSTSILLPWYFGINSNIFVYSSMSGKFIPEPHRAAQPKTSALRILRKYRVGISVGWSCWLQATPPSSSHSSSSIQLKSQPCISREHIGLMFLVTGAAGVFGVAPVSHKNAINVMNALLVKSTIASLA